MPDKNLYRLLPHSLSEKSSRLLLATMLGTLLYCTFLFINLGIVIKFSPAILMESGFCVLFFYAELELMLRLDRYIQKRFKEQAYQVKQYLTEYVAFLLGSLLLLAFVFVLPVLLILNLFNNLNFNEYLWWQLRQSFSLVAVIATLLYLGKIAYVMYVRLKQMEVDTERLQKESVQQQFETMKNYVKPAFLFSSLDTLAELVSSNKEQSAQYIHKLSGVYRYILENKNKELVTLGREIAFLQTYAYLLRIQYKTALNISWDIDEESGDWCLPPLTLQFVIESLLLHFHPTEEKPLKLHISTAEEQLLLCYHTKQTEEPVLFKNNLKKIIQKYEFLSDRKIITVRQEADVLVYVPLLRVSTESPIIIKNL